MWTTLRAQVSKSYDVLWRRYSSKPLSAEEIFKQKAKQADLKRKQTAPEWVKRDEALRRRYGKWNPTRKLSRQQINDIRNLKLQYPAMKTKQLADFFSINPESIRRILKSKWEPTEEELEDINRRAEKRKLASQEKKAERIQQVKNSMANAPQIKGNKSYSKKHKDFSKRKETYSKKPYTPGVGDFID
ncbi:putative protein required for respiratory growth [Clavispora lusitaniae]|uniref:Required for respiratory growth protein 9, mitochondrial n=3 Tax=Clavispora lusitaniae TaxID=36911 RepID=C4Y4G5_CLAL4|nr:uncharacterized protein CLUG_02537 [Clavispora lusitaniae ATCC 42720]KAF7580193.1 Neugrin family protein [Clavispora lusitaniae]EEQ38411.1 hypothetical protein CLUG_02537 [Clavispora lusitaniae ATCC 42720]OVF08848.1 hypothetical protein A9F13_07g03355 [Clavispora lusitaniae]QFZ27755.1 putative protein required for respiratory growth [Clavispora lusitaniae]QFZ32938.1 putative protein required for respiratory growth [Clavispora lusitaniae]